MQTTEELKRAMYEALEFAKLSYRRGLPSISLSDLESNLELYVGRLQEDLGESIQMLREASERIRILEEANRAGGDALREIVSERDSLLAATTHQTKRENAQDAPAAKPHGHPTMFDRLIRICRGMK